MNPTLISQLSSLLVALNYGVHPRKHALALSEGQSETGMAALINADALGLNQIYLQVWTHPTSCLTQEHLQRMQHFMRVHGVQKGVLITLGEIEASASANTAGLICLDGTQFNALLTQYGLNP